MLELLERKLTGQMLRYQAGQQMWCRACERLLDVRDAVSLDLRREGRLEATAMYCGDCWDNGAPSIVETAVKRGFAVEVIDGRTLDDDGLPCDPNQGWRFGDHGTFRTRLRDGAKDVRGISVEFVGDDVPLLARQQPWFAYTERRTWFVVHKTLGMSVSRGVTLRGAMARAIGNLRRATERQLTQAFNPTRGKHDDHKPCRGYAVSAPLTTPLESQP